MMNMGVLAYVKTGLILPNCLTRTVQFLKQNIKSLSLATRKMDINCGFNLCCSAVFGQSVVIQLPWPSNVFDTQTLLHISSTHRSELISSFQHFESPQRRDT